MSLFMLIIPIFYEMFNIYYIYLALPVIILIIYSMIISIMDIENVTKTVDILRLAMALGLIAFVFAIII